MYTCTLWVLNQQPPPPPHLPIVLKLLALFDDCIWMHLGKIIQLLSILGF